MVIYLVQFGLSLPRILVIMNELTEFGFFCAMGTLIDICVSIGDTL